jgi:hypothetical protein
VEICGAEVSEHHINLHNGFKPLPSFSLNLLPLHFGHEICVVGGAKEFGAWNPGKAFALTWSEGDVWKGDVELTVGAVLR